MSDFTTFPAVRAELVRRLREDVFTGTDEPSVFYGDPGRQIPDRYVAVATASGDIEHEIRRLPHDASSSVDEHYPLEVVLWRLVKNGNSENAQQMAVEDVCALAERIDGHLRSAADAWTLGGLVTWCYVSRMTPDDFTLKEGRASQLVLTLEVKAARI